VQRKKVNGPFHFYITTDNNETEMNSAKYINPVNITGIVKIRTFDSGGKGSRTVVLRN